MLTTSPNTKDVCRRRIARWLYEQRPMAIMHDSYKELYRKLWTRRWREGTHDYDFCEWMDYSITVFTADIRQTRQQCEEQGRKLADPKQSPKNMKPGNFVVVQAGDI